MRRAGWVALGTLVIVCASAPVRMRPVMAQDDVAAKNAQKARQALDAMVKALGGDAWLNMQNRMEHGHAAGFYHGNPDPGTLEEFEFHIGREGWEVTYQGKHKLPQDQVDDYLRRRDHSIETAIKVWMKDPKTILVDEGQHLAARHLADQVTLISPDNEALTILMDTQTHLPLRRVFQWRDPEYKDKNTDAEEYDDYHTVGGFPTPFMITRFKNDEMVRQFFIDKVEYNQSLPADFWSVDAADERIKK